MLGFTFTIAWYGGETLVCPAPANTFKIPGNEIIDPLGVYPLVFPKAVVAIFAYDAVAFKGPITVKDPDTLRSYATEPDNASTN